MANPKPYTVLVTGAASGIGRCFTQHYLSQSNTIVIAADINEINIPTPPSRPDGQENELIKIQIDMSSTFSIEEEVRNLKSYWTIPPLDLIIHSAGIRGLVPTVESSQPNNPAAAETLQTMTAETMLRTYQINTLGTFTLLQSLSTNNLFHPPDSANAPTTKVIIMSSRMGSLSYNTAGGGYAYRASKAALNAIVRSMSLDLRHVVFALVHPGRVETGLTMCREEGAIEVEESVGDMLKVIDGLEWKDSGRFMDRWGVDIGW